MVPPPARRRLARFLRKSPRDQILAMRSMLAHLLRPDPLARAAARLQGTFAPARVLRTQQPLYLAWRPDSDFHSRQYPELPALLDSWLHDNVRNNAGDLARLYALAFNLRQLMAEGVPGDCAELGVFRGNSASVIAHYARRAGKTTYLFDTFAGFARSDLDASVPESLITAFDDTGVERVARLVGREGVEFCQGHFPASIPPALHDARFCLVHIDCDLYAPARAALEFFYPRLNPGGMLILHDYANPTWEGIRRAADAFLADRPERLVLLPDKSGTAMLRKAMLPRAVPPQAAPPQTGT
jgi:hypothetical protein